MSGAKIRWRNIRSLPVSNSGQAFESRKCLAEGNMTEWRSRLLLFWSYLFSAIDKIARTEQWTGDISKQGPFGTTCFNK